MKGMCLISHVGKQLCQECGGPKERQHFPPAPRKATSSALSPEAITISLALGVAGEKESLYSSRD